MTGRETNIHVVSVVLIAMNLVTLGYLWYAHTTQAATSSLSTYAVPVLAPDPYPETDDPLTLAEYYFAPAQYDLERAEYYYRQAIRNDPNGSSRAWYQLSRIEFLRADFDAGLSHLQQKIDRFEEVIPNTYYMKGLIYAFRADRFGNVKDWEKAAEHFATFVEYRPQSPWGRIDLAWVYFSMGEHQTMRAVLEPIKDQEFSNPWFLNMYALALFHTGDVAYAKEVITEAYARVQYTTVEDWAAVYPENAPTDWPIGLQEFVTAVERNVSLITTHN